VANQSLWRCEITLASATFSNRFTAAGEVKSTDGSHDKHTLTGESVLLAGVARFFLKSPEYSLCVASVLIDDVRSLGGN
jgi:hypothetical protein